MQFGYRTGIEVASRVELNVIVRRKRRRKVVLALWIAALGAIDAYLFYLLATHGGSFKR